MLVVSVLVGCGDSIPSSDEDAGVATTLKGQLTDAATGEPIVGAIIDVGPRNAITDSNGYYQIANVPADSGSGVSRDYYATIDLSQVSSPIDMADSSTSPRYPELKFTKPIVPDGSTTSANHNFKAGKLSATISGVVGNDNRLSLGDISVELQNNTEGMAGDLIRSATSDSLTGEYEFINIEAGVDYKLVGISNDATLQGEIAIEALTDNQTIVLTLVGNPTLILSNTDEYAPRIIAVSPENNSDISPGAVDVVLTFNEPIYQDIYSIPNPLAQSDNIYQEIDVSYGGLKAAGNIAHTLTWNANYDELTIAIPNTGVSSKYTVDLSLISPQQDGDVTIPGKLKDSAGNTLESSPALSDDSILSFSTNGGVLADAPIITSPDSASLDSGAISVTLDWRPVLGANNGYNVYRSTRNGQDTGIEEPFVFLTGPVTGSIFTDQFDDSGFTLLQTDEVSQYYVYRVTSVNSDYLESLPSNELTIKDLLPPSLDTTATTCVLPGGVNLITHSSDATTTNGQLEITFSEPLNEVTAEDLTNYTASNLSAVKLDTSNTVIFDFSVPISCINAEIVIVGIAVADVAGNEITGSVSDRTIPYAP